MQLVCTPGGRYRRGFGEIFKHEGHNGHEGEGAAMVGRFFATGGRWNFGEIFKHEVSVTPLQKPFLNTKDTKATKEIQRRFEKVKFSRRLS
jgi:hypothetical protein